MHVGYDSLVSIVGATSNREMIFSRSYTAYVTSPQNLSKTLTKGITLSRSDGWLPTVGFYKAVQPGTNFQIGSVFYCLIDGFKDRSLRIDIHTRFSQSNN